MLKRSGPNNPIDTGRKLNVHKTFRRRPRRLLNALCTFNLRPVSTGKEHSEVQRKESQKTHCERNVFWFFVFLVLQIMN